METPDLIEFIDRLTTMVYEEGEENGNFGFLSIIYKQPTNKSSR